MPVGPGSRVAGYELVQPIGSGGMGEVWLAVEVRLQRRVALKLLPPGLTADPARIARFEAEARAASALSHPNVCTVYALGDSADGQLCIAMEYVEGETLRARIQGTRPTIQEALDVAIQTASALSAAHAAGIVHRDVKPENVMIRPDGLVKVVDFGLAKLMSEGPEVAGADTTRGVARTSAGVIVGTLAYMSPEQARGQEIDARADVWALGCILYEMVAGRSPFAGRSGSDTLAAILDRDPPPLARFEPDAPAELQRILNKALRKDRALRYQSARDLLLDAQELLIELRASARVGSGRASADGSLTQARTDAGPPLPGAMVRRRRRAVLSAITAVAIAAGVLWAWTTGRAVPPAPAPSIPVERDLTRLTFGPGLQSDVTFSPDGRFIAYASDRAGNFDIWVQPLAGGDSVQVTKTPAQDTEPDWSPDGSTIAFRSDREGGGIHLIPALGGRERPLTRFGVRPRWSPSGSRLLFLSTYPYLTRHPRLYVIGLDGGVATEVLKAFVSRGDVFTAAWHPDGRVSVIGFHRDQGLGLYVAPADESTPTVKPKDEPGLGQLWGRAFAIPSSHAWSPSGDALSLDFEVNGVGNLWRVAVDPATFEGRSIERLTTGAGRETGVTVSRDGARLAFTMQKESRQLWQFPLDPVSGTTGGKGLPITDDGVQVGTSDVTRDGRWVAYDVTRAGSDRHELWMTDLHARRTVVEAADSTWRLSPRWSPDGRGIAFSGFDPKRGMNLLLVRDRGGHEQTVAELARGYVQPGDWMPDGSGIVGVTRRPDWPATRLCLWPAAVSASAVVNAAIRDLASDEGYHLFQPRLSPTGKWLAFVYQAVNGSEQGIALAPSAMPDLPSRQWTRVAAEHEWLDKPRWSSDGRFLYFLSRRSGYLNAWAVAVAPDSGRLLGHPFPITNFQDPSFFISPAVTDTEMGVGGRRLVTTMVARTGSIWMLDSVGR